VSESRLMVAHAHMLLPIEVHTKILLLLDKGKLCSKFGEDRSINNVTLVSTDAGRTPDAGNLTRLRGFISCH